jgi:hypothetical protein
VSAAPTPETKAKVEARLVALRQFLAACPLKLSGGRIVRYGGGDVQLKADILLADIEQRVSDCVCEGLAVDWMYRNEVLYLRVTESSGHAPSWERLFAEQDVADAQDVLRRG